MAGLEYSPGNNSIRYTGNANKSFYCYVPEQGQIDYNVDTYKFKSQMWDKAKNNAITKKCDAYNYESLEAYLLATEVKKEIKETFNIKE